MKRGIASDCTGELSSEQFIRQLRDSGKNEPVIEMFVIEAKTIEVCRVATVARLREIENEIRTNLKTLHDRIPGDISFWPKEMKEERLILRGQWSCIGRLIDYCSRPARYEAMVRRSKDA